MKTRKQIAPIFLAIMLLTPATPFQAFAKTADTANDAGTSLLQTTVVTAFSSSPAKAPNTFSTGRENTWIKDDEGWKYYDSNDSEVEDGWAFIDNKWYHFAKDGYMETGLILEDEKTYYCAETGQMLTGWICVEEYPKDYWIYCGEDGAMLRDVFTPDGYYVGPDGAWVPEVTADSQTE